MSHVSFLYAGVQCELGRTTFLLQEGQAVMQEACTCHQCVDALMVLKSCL